MFAILTTFSAGLVSGMPVAFVLGLCGLAYFLVQEAAPATLASQLFSALSVPSLLAIPFFILAAEIMSRTGATTRLIRFIDTLMGHTRGGMPVVAVIATVMFSSISGSSVATAAAIGTVLIPEMVKRGYDRTFAVGLVASAGGLGILLPPSVPLVVYGIVTETSIAKLFTAGAIVGIVLSALLVLIAYLYGCASKIPPQPKASRSERRSAFKAAFGVLLSPLIVLGGIYSGYFTPMEAAAVSCIYAIALALGYGVSVQQMLPILTSAAKMSSIIMMILAGAQLFGYALTSERIPHALFDIIMAMNLSPVEFLVGVMLLFLLIGMALEVISVILITMPILMPMLTGLDIDPLFFGMMLILNMEIAVITPPIGLNLFAISAISGVPVMRVFKGCLPFVLLLLVMLATMTFVPQIQEGFSRL